MIYYDWRITLIAIIIAISLLLVFAISPFIFPREPEKKNKDDGK